MIVSDKDKPSLESLILAHHGVAGMKWGIRKAPTTAQANRARNSVTALTKDAAKVNYAKKSFGGAYKIHTM